MNELKLELQKEIYNGLTDAEALAALPVQVAKVGRIQNEDKLDLLTLVITSDLIKRYEEAKNKTDEELLLPPETCIQYREVARVLQEAFNPSYVLSDVYRINLGLPDIRGIFDAGLAFGLITQDEYNKLIELATYKEGVDFSAYKEADVSQARVELNVNVPVDARAVKYGGTELDYMIKQANEDIKFFVVFDESVTEDCVVDIHVWEQPTVDLPHVKTAKVNVLRVNAGDINVADTLTKNLKRKIKFSATCNKNFPFTLYVQW